MTDPVSADMANQAVQSAAELQDVQGTGGDGDFSETMAQADAGPQDASAVQEPPAVDEIDQVDGIEAASEIPTDDFVQRLLDEESNIQDMMQNCLNGSEMGQEEMLQMQAVIYSYSQRVDLTTKVVENATSGIKDVMNTQV